MQARLFALGITVKVKARWFAWRITENVKSRGLNFALRIVVKASLVVFRTTVMSMS